MRSATRIRHPLLAVSVAKARFAAFVECILSARPETSNVILVNGAETFKALSAFMPIAYPFPLEKVI